MINLPIEIGDLVLGGRFKNKKIIVKDISVDSFGNPTINGRGILKIRILKLYQKQEQKEMKEDLKRLIKKVIKEEKNRLIEDWEIEAYGVRGMKSTPWRKKFKSPEQLDKWCEQNDAEVEGTSYLLNGREIRQSDSEYQNLPDNFKGE